MKGEKRNIEINQTSADNEKHLFDRILKYTGLFGGIQGVSIMVTLVLTKIKSVLLGPVGYGITESLNRTTDLVRNSTNLGIATVAVPVISQHTDQAECEGANREIMLTRSWALLTAILGMTVCVILAPILSRWAFNGDKGYTSSFVALSLAVAATAITGGETAVLRGTGMLRQIALSQLFTGLFSLVVSVPLYWFLRHDGIVLAITLSSLGSMAITCFYSCRRFQYYAKPFSLKILREGTGMIGFGIFFTIAAFLSAWAWSYIAHYLLANGGMELTGSYSAGYMLVTYMATMLFSVTDSEYYPRLSAVCDDKNQVNSIVNNQLTAMSMLAAPIVILFMIVVPAVVYVVLEYDKFHASIMLAQMAVMGLYFKAVSQPVAYILLARSDSKVYLLQEALCYITLVACVVLGYKLGGTICIGLSLAAWELLYLLLVLVVSRIRYGFIMYSESVRKILIQGAIVVLTGLCVWADTRLTFALSVVLCMGSVVIAIRFFISHTTLVPNLLKNRLLKR